MGSPTLKELVEQMGQNKGSLYTRLQNLLARGALSAEQGPRGLVYRVAARGEGDDPTGGGPGERRGFKPPASGCETG